MSRKGTNLLAVIILASSAAGTAVAFAAADTNQPAPSDSQISQQVVQKLTREMPDSFVDLHVQTENGVVTLSGRADTATSKIRAEQDVRQVHGVTGVKDDLQIAS